MFYISGNNIEECEIWGATEIKLKPSFANNVQFRKLWCCRDSLASRRKATIGLLLVATLLLFLYESLILLVILLFLTTTMLLSFAFAFALVVFKILFVIKLYQNLHVARVFMV